MSHKKCGFAAIVGASNVGKSTLVNSMAGRKVSIVTHKMQTTRTAVRCVLMRGSTQIIVVDTPGLFFPTRPLERAMVAAARQAAGEADCLICLVDARIWSSGGANAIEKEKRLISRLMAYERPMAVVINKIDRIHKPRLLSAAERLSRVCDGQIMMISALTGDGVQDVIAWCARMMPDGTHLYPDGNFDSDLAFLAAELVREAAMLRLHQELPYRLVVETVSCEERPQEVRIACRIIVADDRHRPMVIGRGGSVLGQIGQRARVQLSDILGIRVHLVVEVVTRLNWPDRYDRDQTGGSDSDASFRRWFQRRPGLRQEG